MNEHALKYEDIKNEIMIMDHNGIIGKVINCDDIHNIEVKYLNGGCGLYCMMKDCPISLKDGSLYLFERN